MKDRMELGEGIAQSFKTLVERGYFPMYTDEEQIEFN